MKRPRIMISAPASGSGKTLVTCGLLMAFKKRGIEQMICQKEELLLDINNTKRYESKSIIEKAYARLQDRKKKWPLVYY